MKIENTEVFGFRAALRAMRNPKESWEANDSYYYDDSRHAALPISPPWGDIHAAETPDIGPEDLALAKKLIKAGSDHRKFMRQICVWVTWTLPRYVHTELDTYKVATVRNSCSTMHKLGHRDLTVDDFQDGDVLLDTLRVLNAMGRAYREKKQYGWGQKDGTVLGLAGYGIVRMMKKILPEGFLQKSTYTCNYETLLNMYHSRRNHRLPEWNAKHTGSICQWIESLPYMQEFLDL